MKKLKPTFFIITILMVTLFSVPSIAIEFPNLFDSSTRIAVPTEIDPWKVHAEWEQFKIFKCPEGDIDLHIVYKNPDKAATIKFVEIVISMQNMYMPLGVICSYSYMKDGEWHAFWQADLDSSFFTRWDGDEEIFHGGFFFRQGSAKNFKGDLE